MKPSLFTKLSKTCVREVYAVSESLELSSGSVPCFTWFFDWPFDFMFARDFVVDSWNETRDAGIWMFLEDGSEGTSDEGIMDNWSKIRLLSERSLHIQIDAIKAIHASGKRIEDAIRIFTKLHSLLGADLLTVMSSASGILVKAPAKLTKRTIAPVLEELLAHTRKYKLFSDITAEQAVQITLSGGVFFL